MYGTRAQAAHEHFEGGLDAAMCADCGCSGCSAEVELEGTDGRRPGRGRHPHRSPVLFAPRTAAPDPRRG